MITGLCLVILHPLGAALSAVPAPRVGVPALPRHLLVPQITRGQHILCILSQICRVRPGELTQPNLGMVPCSLTAKRAAASAGSSQQAADGAGKGEGSKAAWLPAPAPAAAGTPTGKRSPLLH